VKSIYH